MAETGEAFAPHTTAVTEASRSHLNKIFTLLHALGGKTSPTDHLEEEVFRIREGYQNFRLEPVETTHPDVSYYSSPRPQDLHLVYFARTLQRTQLIGHFIHKGFEVPVHYSITGAIILKRVARKFHVWGAPKLQSNVLLPFNFVDDRSILERYTGDAVLHLHDSGGDRPEYTQLRIAALRKAQGITVELRRQLYEQWRHEEGADPAQVLVFSGMIENIPNDQLTSNILAIADRVYVPWQNSELLEPQLIVPAYQRGQLMRVVNTEGADPMPKYTWFVRLRTSAKADPEFGLVRCTCLAPDDASAGPRANAFTARLVDERLPVTFPAEDWDKLIFPVKLCRDYLESLIATRDTVKSYFARN
jgi:hypothetical protein